MQTSKKNTLEKTQLSALHRLRILDSIPEESFDEIVNFSSQICQTPIAAISLIDGSKKWLSAKVGEHANLNLKDLGFCSHARFAKDILIIPDSSRDERFSANALNQGERSFKFYAGAPILSPDGHVIGTLCVLDHEARDLTAEQSAALMSLAKQIQRSIDLKTQLGSLKAINARLEFKKTALDSIDEGVLLFNSEGQVVEFNAAASKILELSADNLRGRTFVDLQWKKIDADGMISATTVHPAQLALRTGRRQQKVRMTFHTVDSQMVSILVNAVPIYLEEQVFPSHVIVSFSNISDEVAVSDLFLKKETRLRNLLDSVPAMIGSWSKDLINLSANKAYLDYFGKTPDEIIGKSMQDILGPELFAKNKPHIDAVLAGRTQTFERELPYYNGTTHNTLATYLPEFEDGKVIGFMVIVMDITELKKAESQRKEIEARLLESAQLSTVGEVAGGIAHEINNPLMVIQGSITALKRQMASPNPDTKLMTKYFDKIDLMISRTTKIIEALTAITSKLNKVQIERVAFSSILEEATLLCQERLKLLGIELIVEGPVDTELSCSPPQIIRLLLNLINNSVDAISPMTSKWIKISFSTQGQFHFIEVQDSGRAIKASIVKKLMQPFFTTKEIGKGTGLGLSVSKGIAEAHGGTLKYQAKDEHPCFILEIPAE